MSRFTLRQLHESRDAAHATVSEILSAVAPFVPDDAYAQIMLLPKDISLRVNGDEFPSIVAGAVGLEDLLPAMEQATDQMREGMQYPKRPQAPYHLVDVRTKDDHAQQVTWQHILPYYLSYRIALFDKPGAETIQSWLQELVSDPAVFYGWALKVAATERTFYRGTLDANRSTSVKFLVKGRTYLYRESGQFVLMHVRTAPVRREDGPRQAAGWDCDVRWTDPSGRGWDGSIGRADKGNMIAMQMWELVPPDPKEAQPWQPI